MLDHNSVLEILSRKHCSGEDLSSVLEMTPAKYSNKQSGAHSDAPYTPDCEGLQKDVVKAAISNPDCTGHGPAWIPSQCDCDGPDCGGGPWGDRAILKKLIIAAHADCTADCHCQCDCTEIIYA